MSFTPQRFTLCPTLHPRTYDAEPDTTANPTPIRLSTMFQALNWAPFFRSLRRLQIVLEANRPQKKTPKMDNYCC